MAASAAFSIDGQSVPRSTGEAVSTTYGATVTLTLDDVTGAASIAWAIVGVDNPNTAIPTITRTGTPLGSTATFTAGSDPGTGLGISYRVRCRVTDALGVNYDKFGIVGVPSSSGNIPFAYGEGLQDRHPTMGWTPSFNARIERAGGGTVNVQTYSDLVTDGDWTAAIHAAVDAAGASGARRPRVHLPPGLYTITSPIEIHDKGSGVNTLLRISGDVGGSNAGSADYATGILWAGGAGTAAIELHSRNCTIENLGIMCESGSSLTCGIDVDQSAEAGASICTENAIRNVAFVGVRIGYGTIEHGIRIGNTATTNCEFMIIEDCSGPGLSGYLIYQPNTASQALLHRINRCSVKSGGGSAPGGLIWIESGSFTARDCVATDCTLPTFKIGSSGWRQTITIENFQTESCVRMLEDLQRDTPVIPSPIVIRGGRWAIASMASDGEWIRSCSRTPIRIDGVEVPVNHTQDNRIFKIKSTHTGASVVATSCLFPNDSPFDVGGRLVVQGCMGANLNGPGTDADSYSLLPDQIATGYEPGQDPFADIPTIADLSPEASWSATGLSGAQATLTDLTGNGHTLTSVVASTTATTVDGFDGLVFTGAANYFEDAANTLAPLMHAGSWTIATRFRVTDFAANNSIVAVSTNSANGYVLFRSLATSGLLYCVHTATDGTSDGSGAGRDMGAASTTADQNAIISFNDETQCLTVWVDGVIRTLDPRDYSAETITALTEFCWGAVLRPTVQNAAKMTGRRCDVWLRELTGYEKRAWMLRADEEFS